MDGISQSNCLELKMISVGLQNINIPRNLRYVGFISFKDVKISLIFRHSTYQDVHYTCVVLFTLRTPQSLKFA